MKKDHKSAVLVESKIADLFSSFCGFRFLNNNVSQEPSFSSCQHLILWEECCLQIYLLNEEKLVILSNNLLSFESTRPSRGFEDIFTYLQEVGSRPGSCSSGHMAGTAICQDCAQQITFWITEEAPTSIDTPPHTHTHLFQNQARNSRHSKFPESFNLPSPTPEINFNVELKKRYCRSHATNNHNF